MCHHHVHVMLSAEDKAAAKTITGWLIPVYAAVVLAVVSVVSVVSVTGGPPRGELVAATTAPAGQR